MQSHGGGLPPIGPVFSGYIILHLCHNARHIFTTVQKKLSCHTIYIYAYLTLVQGGKFDHADRLFQSIESAYINSLSSTSDVKELIPEFFYMPEFLENSNSYHLGVKQDGEPIGDVALPPWAKVIVPLDVSCICHNSFLEDELVHQDSSVVFLMTVSLALQLLTKTCTLLRYTGYISSFLNINIDFLMKDILG